MPLRGTFGFQDRSGALVRFDFLRRVRHDWFPRPDSHRHCDLHKVECYYYNTEGMENVGAPCRCCPDVSSLEDSHVTVTSMTR